MTHDHIRGRDDVGVRHPPLNPNIWGQWIECEGIASAAHGEEHADRKIGNGLDCDRENCKAICGIAAATLPSAM